PLPKLTVAGEGAAALEPFFGLIADELNVKAVEASADRESFGSLVLRPNARVLGPRLGGDVQAVIKAAKAGDWTQGADGSITVAGHKLDDGEYELALQASDDQATAAVRMLDPEGRAQDLGLVVALDTTVTPELYAEGVARDLVRIVQQARKDAGLDVSDRIELTLQLPAAQRAMVAVHESTVADSVLATALAYVDDAQDHTATLDGVPISLSLTRA
ncbi:MAG TPA: DUF5915 domain-containing protein, partial [Acidimicrobiales bacterium]